MNYSQEAHKKDKNTEVSAPIPTTGGDEWEEEFACRFSSIGLDPKHYLTYNELFTFIRENRVALLQRLEEEVRADDDKGNYSDPKWPRATQDEADGWNARGRKVVEIITNFKKQ